MQRPVDSAVFIDAVIVLLPHVFPAGFELLKRKLVRSVPVNLVGVQEHKNCLGTMETTGLQKIHSAERVNFEIEHGDISGLVVGRLCGAMDNQIERLGAE
jgi:hypothetical protein